MITQNEKYNEYSLQQKVVRGGLWVSIGFASQQALGVARTLVLARQLTPADFGIMGFVALILFAGNILSELNLTSALVQKSRLTDRYLHTCWSFSLLRGIILAIALIGLAPYLADLLGYSELVPYLRVGALSFLLVTLPAVPKALLLRKLKYKKFVKLNILSETVTVMLSIFLGVYLKSAWALLWGLLAGQFVSATLIWLVDDYRPKWLLDRESLVDLWRFGIPLYVSGLITYLVTRGDDLIVNKLRGIEALGRYQMVFNIAEMLTRGLSDIVSRAVFPAYSRIVGEDRDLGHGFAEVWKVMVLLLLPVTGVLVVFPSAIIQILLGNQWLDAAPTLALLAVGETLRSMAVPLGNVIVASGCTVYLARIKLLEAAVFCILILPMTFKWGIAGAAASLIVVYAFTLIGSIYLGNRVARILRPFFDILLEPLVITLLIGMVVYQIPLSGTLMALFLVLGWGLIWGFYVLLRHRPLLSKFYLALRGGLITAE